MTPALWGEVKRLFAAALALPKEEAATLLRDVDPVVRAEVLSLLDHHTDDDLIASASSTSSPSTPTMNPLDPAGLLGRRVGDVDVDAFVAAGGFGAVYRGRRREGVVDGGRVVALKVFAPRSTSAAEEQRAAFEAEAVVLRALADRADAIVRCDGVGVVDGRPLILLEWIEGRTLAAVLESSRQPWPLSRVVELFAPIATALGAAHERGVAHRDLKPDNIMVTPDLQLRLLDFGVAKVVGDVDNGFLSTTGRVGMATLRWAAPEQVARELGPTGPWTDVFSFALVLVDLLSGQRAASDVDLATLLLRGQRGQAPQTPRALGVDVSAAVDDAFAAALRVPPQERTASVAEFWRALTR